MAVSAGTRALLRPAGFSTGQLEEALQACEAIAARDRSSLYRASQFFEDRSRHDAFIAMYAVMRVIDDRIDGVRDAARLPAGERAGLEAELERWTARIRAAYDGRPSSDPLDVALAAAVLTFPVPIRIWLGFLEAMRFEVQHSCFEDFAEFLAYAEGATVAPTAIYVYLLTSVETRPGGPYQVGGFDFETCGRELGRFAYLAHILRDVARDMGDDRGGLVYLSREDLQRHDLDDEVLRGFIAKGEGDDRWRSLVKDLCARAHAMEARGSRMAEARYAHMPKDCAFILCLIIRLYSDLLRRIEAAPDAVLSGRSVAVGPDEAALAAVAARIMYPLSRVLEKSRGGA